MVRQRLHDGVEVLLQDQHVTLIVVLLVLLIVLLLEQTEGGADLGPGWGGGVQGVRPVALAPPSLCCP